MAGKISEMSAASALDGSELVEVVQSGANKKVTINDLLPVQLQEAKSIELNGHDFIFTQNGDIVMYIDPDPTYIYFRAPIVLGIEGGPQGEFKMTSPDGTLWVVTMQDDGTFLIGED